MPDDLKTFFLEPKSPKQRQYEALRAYVLDGLTAGQVAQRFDFTEKTLYSLAHDLRAGKLELFPQADTGPRDRRMTPHLRNGICDLRRLQRLSTRDIVQKLKEEGISTSESTVERILKDNGFSKLKRRSAAERGVGKKNNLLPETSRHLDLSTLKPFHAECQVAGLFLFLPYILESGILEIVQRLPLPESSRIGKTQAFLSFMAMKLIGCERLSHIRRYDCDRGLGLFAGLNVLPKPTYMGTYSCLVSAEICLSLQQCIIEQWAARHPDSFSGSTINLDFHSIPHFGEKSEMEKVWCGARGKPLKGANTFFAQDAETNELLYANADVLRSDSSEEILHFAEYWRSVRGVVSQTLVFDSRVTTYGILGILDRNDIRFITLRKRNKGLLDDVAQLQDDQWEKVRLPIPKRKHQNFLAHESEVKLTGGEKPVRQIIIKDHGRAQPTFVITNNRDLSLVDVLTVYARRWRIENKLAELVGFFNLNSLSSPIMMRIHFDLLLSVVATLLYQRLAADLPRFEKHRAPDIFRRFIDMPGQVRYDGEGFEVLIRKRSHTPILLGVDKLARPVEIPWLENRNLKITFKS